MKTIMNEHNCRATAAEILRMLGFEKGRTPPEGFAPQSVQGFLVWASPLKIRDVPKGMGRFERWQKFPKRSKQRLLVRCPGCGREMGVSRLHQHVCKGEQK